MVCIIMSWLDSSPIMDYIMFFFHGGMVLKFWVRCAIMRCSIVLLAGISLDTISPLRFLTYPDWTYPKVYALNNMPGYIF